MDIIPIAIVGVGKIARDQHVPTIAASDRFTLAGVVSTSNADVGVPSFATLADLRAAQPDTRAVAICTPPRGRTELVREALALGFDVLLEKPPAATLAEASRFADMARAAGRALYLSWHSREAAAVGVAAARLAGRRVDRVTIRWLEDVRVWHPGQEWIWQPGIGVFDPGINALSILTRLLPDPTLTAATLDFPANRDAPIAATLEMTGVEGAAIHVGFSFDQRGPQTWTMRLDTDAGVLELVDGGARLLADGAPVEVPDEPEYARLYAHFAELVDARGIDADVAPFRLVADAFMLGQRRVVEAFDWAQG